MAKKTLKLLLLKSIFSQKRKFAQNILSLITRKYIFSQNGPKFTDAR